MLKVTSNRGVRLHGHLLKQPMPQSATFITVCPCVMHCCGPCANAVVLYVTT